MDNTARNAASRIGCHCWGTGEASVAGLPYSAQVGCRWVRSTRPMQMDTVLMAPGRYDFAAHGERSVNLAIEQGMSVMAILDARWGNETGLNVLGSCSPVWERLDVWADFARQAAAFYKDRVKYWEIINEPPFFWWYPTPPGVRMPDTNPDIRRAPIRHYAALLKASAKAIREADPDAAIVAGAGFSDGAFLRKLYELGCKDDFDVASVHYVNCRHPDDFARCMRTLRGVMSQYGDGGKPLWDTENGPGGAVIGHAVQTPAEYAALYNVYRHCFAYEFGMDRYFWFNSEPAKPDERGILQPAYRAMATLHRFVGEGPLLASEHFDGEGHLYVFAGQRGPVSILWSTAPATARVKAKEIEAADYLGNAVTLEGTFALTGCPLFVAGDISGELDVSVKGKRETIVTPMKQPPADVPGAACPRVRAPLGIHDAAWERVPYLVRHDDMHLLAAQDHFSKVSSSVKADVQLACGQRALKLRVRTYDDQLDANTPTGLVQFSLRDSNPAVAEWGYFTNGYGLINLFLGKRGPMVLRYEHLRPDEYPAGIVKAAQIEVEPAGDGLLFCTGIPWAEIGPCRPGKHEPFLMMFTFNRADAMLDVPAEDEPWEWSHNFGDTFIVKPPALARWLKFGVGETR